VDKSDISAVCNIPQAISILEQNLATNRIKILTARLLPGGWGWETLSREHTTKHGVYVPLVIFHI